MVSSARGASTSQARPRGRHRPAARGQSWRGAPWPGGRRRCARPAGKTGELRGLQLQRAAAATGLRHDAHLRVTARPGEQLRGVQVRTQRRQRRIAARLTPQRQAGRQIERRHTPVEG